MEPIWQGQNNVQRQTCTWFCYPGSLSEFHASSLCWRHTTAGLDTAKTPGGYSSEIWVGVCGSLLGTLPYFRPKYVIFRTLFQTWPKIPHPISDQTFTLFHQRTSSNFDDNQISPLRERNLNKKVASSADQSAHTITYFETKIVKIYTIFKTKTAQKPYPLGPHVPIWLI